MDHRVEWIITSFDHRQDRLETEVRHLTETVGEALLSRRLVTLAPRGNGSMPADTARFLNWAEGPEGPAARAGLWFNPAVATHYAEGGAGILLVNERIVEQPYAYAALTALPLGARILDVGGSESTVALSLASLGYEVHVVDPRGYPLEHPLLREHAMRLHELPDELRFDGALALSAIEHFGLGAYGQPRQADVRADIAALKEIHRRLTPGGLLVLTVPCASTSSADDFQRVYSPEDLNRMLASDWDVADISVAWHPNHRTWVRGTIDEPQADVGVALVVAQKSRGGSSPASTIVN
jgi:SAM-dependent methyltransferase